MLCVLRASCLILTLLLPLATGCGSGDDSPTAPTPDPEPGRVWLMESTITRFECIYDGDGIEGAGDFYFGVTVNSAFSKAWERQLSDGQSSNLNWTESFYLPYQGEEQDVTVQFYCTELDEHLINGTFPDADMNNETRTATETLSDGESITNRITLGNDNCKVRIHYVLTGNIVEYEP